MERRIRISSSDDIAVDRLHRIVDRHMSRSERAKHGDTGLKLLPVEVKPAAFLKILDLMGQ